MPTKTEPLMLRVTNVEILQQHVENLQELAKELSEYNPRNVPLKGSTKDRWHDTIQAASTYFQRFLPKKE